MINKKDKKFKKGEGEVLRQINKLGVMMENTDSKVDFLVEGHKTLDRKIDRVDAKVDNLKEEMDYKFDIVFGELRVIRNELKNKVDRDEFLLLEKRVVALEKMRTRK